MTDGAKVKLMAMGEAFAPPNGEPLESVQPGRASGKVEAPERTAGRFWRLVPF